MPNFSVEIGEVVTPALEPEDQFLSGVSLVQFTEEELAAKWGQIEDKVHNSRGVWWRRSRLGWYQPCFPLSPIDHRTSWPSPLRAIAGYTHVAAPDSPANGKYRTIMRADIPSYRFRSLPKDRRANVRKALATLSIRPIEDVGDLLVHGYEVYLSCHGRVRWGRDKSDRAVFQNWVARAYRQKGFALGAYKDDKLVGFMIPHRVGDTVVMSYTASHSDFLQYRLNDGLYHALLCLARQSPGVTHVDFGPVCAKETLNQFKLTFAALYEYPSYTWIHPVIRNAVRNRFWTHYPWLTMGEENRGTVTS